MGDLSKWPLLLVHGDPVTTEQANEILVRTDEWYLCSNDRAWERQVYDLAGIATVAYGAPDLKSLQAFRRSINALDLSYLCNARIVSSWIGGPHGWCDWDGTIGCSTWNVGKWPSVEELTEEWSTIAAAFPYLDLRAQVVGDEGEAGHPAAEWRVTKGAAHLVEPIGLLRSTDGLDVPMAVASLFGSVGRERGVSLDRLRTALDSRRTAS